MGFIDTRVMPTNLQRQMPLITSTLSRVAGKGTFLYACYVIDLKMGILESFGFDISPAQMRLEEDAAADIVATQDGGYYTDERGQYFKMLTVGGTFGFRPTRRGTGGGSSALTQAANQVDQAIATIGSGGGIPNDEYTGYDRYLKLHNLIRYYWDLKKTRYTAPDVVFVWADWKMGEIYIAQPLKFSRDRSSPTNRYQITYNFVLRLVAPLTFIPRKDFLTSPGNQQGKVSFLQRLRAISQMLSAANNLVKTFITTGLDFGTDLVRGLYQPINELVGSISTISSSVDYARKRADEVVNFPVETIRALYRTSLDVESVIEKIKNTPDSWIRSYETASQMTHVFTRVARLLAGAYVGMIATVVESDVNTEAGDIGRNYKQWDSAAAINDNIVPDGDSIPGDNGSGTSLGKRTIDRGSQLVTLPGRTSIKALAANFLGSAGRWKEIALLNRLKPPYFSPQGDGITVLRPGDPVRLPAQPDTSGDVNQVYSTQNDLERIDEYRYGRDLRVDPITHDFVIDARGDLDTIAGKDNLKQAMYIKIWTKPGDLKVHSWFGFGAEPGDGVSVDLLSGYQFQLRATLMSDTRIATIRSMSLELEKGDILRIKALLEPKAQDDSLMFETRASLR